MENYSERTEKVINSLLEMKDFLMVMFTSALCNNCIYVQEILLEFRKNKVPVFFVEAVSINSVAKKYSVTVTPTVVVFKDKEIIAHIEGMQHRQRYVHYLRYFKR
jgi:thioredoxin-related protein